MTPAEQWNNRRVEEEALWIGHRDSNHEAAFLFLLICLFLFSTCAKVATVSCEKLLQGHRWWDSASVEASQREKLDSFCNPAERLFKLVKRLL